MVKALGNSLRMVQMGRRLDVSKISRAIEVNFSGIYTQKVIDRMIKREQRRQEKADRKSIAEKDKKAQTEFREDDPRNPEELKKREEEKERKRQEKIARIREQQQQKGYETKNKLRIKNTSEMLFKKQYLAMLRKEKTEKIKMGYEEKKKFLSSHNVLKIIRANLLQRTGRYLMLFYDNGLTLSILYKSVRSLRTKTHFMLGSRLDADVKSNQYAIEKIKRIKFYASQGFLVVLKDLENIYGVLYDLFNQRFSEDSGSKAGHTCFVTYEDFKEPMLIHPDFRIILLKSEHDLISDSAHIERKLPSPLVNRFQKHILLLHNVTKPGGLTRKP